MQVFCVFLSILYANYFAEILSIFNILRDFVKNLKYIYRLQQTGRLIEVPGCVLGTWYFVPLFFT